MPSKRSVSSTVSSDANRAVVGLLLIADTHVPGRAKDLPPALWARVDEADAVVHAGDWVVDSARLAARRRLGGAVRDVVLHRVQR